MVRTQSRSENILQLAIHSLLRIDCDCQRGAAENNAFRFAGNLLPTSSLSASFNARPVRSGCTFILPVLRPEYSGFQHQQNGCVGMDAAEVERGVAPHDKTRAGRSFNSLAIRLDRGVAQSQSRYAANSDGSLPEEVAHGVAPRSITELDRSRWATCGQCSRNGYPQSGLVAGVWPISILHGGKTVCGQISTKKGYRPGTWDCRLAGRGIKNRTRRCLPAEQAGNRRYQKNLRSRIGIYFPLAVSRRCFVAAFQANQRTGWTADGSLSLAGLHEANNCQPGCPQRVGGDGSAVTRALVAGHYTSVLSRPENLQRAVGRGLVAMAKNFLIRTIRRGTAGLVRAWRRAAWPGAVRQGFSKYQFAVQGAAWHGLVWHSKARFFSLTHGGSQYAKN